ncbi:MAG: hypothetical protein KAH32_05285 [Chlamydiia bacterium]|nr:hypothetical protein [Chlamydiia bacterium]
MQKLTSIKNFSVSMGSKTSSLVLVGFALSLAAIASICIRYILRLRSKIKLLTDEKEVLKELSENSRDHESIFFRSASKDIKVERLHDELKDALLDKEALINERLKIEGDLKEENYNIEQRFIDQSLVLKSLQEDHSKRLQDLDAYKEESVSIRNINQDLLLEITENHKEINKTKHLDNEIHDIENKRIREKVALEEKLAQTRDSCSSLIKKVSTLEEHVNSLMISNLNVPEGKHLVKRQISSSSEEYDSDSRRSIENRKQEYHLTDHYISKKEFSVKNLIDIYNIIEDYSPGLRISDSLLDEHGNIINTGIYQEKMMDGEVILIEKKDNNTYLYSLDMKKNISEVGKFFEKRMSYFGTIDNVLLLHMVKENFVPLGIAIKTTENNQNTSKSILEAMMSACVGLYSKRSQYIDIDISTCRSQIKDMCLAWEDLDNESYTDSFETIQEFAQEVIKLEDSNDVLWNILKNDSRKNSDLKRSLEALDDIGHDDLEVEEMKILDHVRGRMGACLFSTAIEAMFLNHGESVSKSNPKVITSILQSTIDACSLDISIGKKSETLDSRESAQLKSIKDTKFQIFDDIDFVKKLSSSFEFYFHERDLDIEYIGESDIFGMCLLEENSTTKKSYIKDNDGSWIDTVSRIVYKDFASMYSDSYSKLCICFKA